MRPLAVRGQTLAHPGEGGTLQVGALTISATACAIDEPSTTTRIFAARALRDFGDGFVAVLLPVYLAAIGFGAFEIGLVATLALSGSALLTLAIGFVGKRIDARRLLIIASALMIAPGIAFAASAATALVLMVAFVGTINLSAGSVSFFAPLEQALLPDAVAAEVRTKMFARYSLVGSLAAALGALASASPDIMQTLGLDRP